MAEDRDLAAELFGADPDELPGRWTTAYCGTFEECPRCPNCPGLGHWRFEPRLGPSAATRPTAGTP